MVSKGLLFALSLVVLLVTNCYPTCHARLLKGIVLRNEDGNDNVLGVTASIPGLNLALPTRFFETFEHRAPVLSIANGGDGGRLDVEEAKKSEYEKLRTLVLASLPKGTGRSSAPSLRHNDFKT